VVSGIAILKSFLRYFRSFLFLTVSLSLACTSTRKPEKPVNSGTGRNIVEYADHFSLVKENDYTILTIRDPWQGAKNIDQIFYLVRNGSKPPDGADPAKVIFVPIRKIICMSTTHCAMISALDERNSVVAVSGADYFYEDHYLEKIKSGEIKEIGYDENINKELVIKLDPDIIMIYGVGSEATGYHGKIRELGYRVMFNADYLEVNPLGKAEWIKLFGALYCIENRAAEIFVKLRNEYDSIRTYIDNNSAVRPSVLLGLPWKDIWYTSPGNSYISMIIRDAGGSYLWEDTSSDISLPYGLENVFVRAVKADYWLNTGTAKSMDDIRAADGRFAELPCFRNGRLFNNNNRINAAGGNDYWESGCLNPHVILKDIGAILHPGLFPGYEPFYYKKLE
jgi:iron complex transport system substrate-binding protein